MTQANYKPFIFALYPEDDQRLDEIAARMADILGQRRPNRSDALRRIVADFDVEAWAARQRLAAPEPDKAA